jgi:hypothetical protein
VRTGRRWVRERFDAVEIPLNRTKKSRKARNNCLGLVFLMEELPSRCKN